MAEEMESDNALRQRRPLLVFELLQASQLSKNVVLYLF